MRLKDESSVALVVLITTLAGTAQAADAEPVPAVLERLDASRTKPSVILHLASGRDLEGVLLDVTKQAVLLGRPAGISTYVELHRVEAVSVIPTAAPTKADLTGAAKEMERAVGIAIDLDWRSIPDSDAARRVLARSLEDAGAALKRIAADDDGRAALKKVSRVTFAVGEKRDATLERSTLHIRADATGALDDREIQKRVEAQL